MDKKIVVLGAGGHAKIILDVLKLNHMNICGLTDAASQGEQFCLGFPVLGNDGILPELFEQGICNAAMGIGHVGNPNIRNAVYNTAKQIGYSFPNIIHPQAVLSETVKAGEGILFAAQCVVNADAVVGNLCIVNTAAVVEHDVVIEDGVHVAPHATLLGMVHVGKNSFIARCDDRMQLYNWSRRCCAKRCE